MRWAQQQRMMVIANLLASRGFVNRKDLVEFFEISVPQASIDLREFMKLHPDAMRYNSSSKRYERVTQQRQGD